MTVIETIEIIVKKIIPGLSPMSHAVELYTPHDGEDALRM